jgi:hypothetical protein
MRIGKWHQAAIYAALIPVCTSGVAWFILHDFVEEEPTELQRKWLVIHGVAAFAALMVFGSVFPLHVRASWNGKRNIGTGLSIGSIMAALTVTALFLYYGGEDTRFLARWGHIAVGLIAIPMFPLHLVLGRMSRNSASKHLSRPSSGVAGERQAREKIHAKPAG